MWDVIVLIPNQCLSIYCVFASLLKEALKRTLLFGYNTNGLPSI